MTVADLGHVAPLLIVAVWSLLVLLADAFSGAGSRVAQRRLTMLGLGFALVAVVLQMRSSTYTAGIHVFADFLVVEPFALFVDAAILGFTGLVVLFAGDYARHRRFEYGEQESLLLIAAFGAMVIAHANDLLALFLGIETMSIAAYVLVGARWNSKLSSEAAMKYFLMGAFASGLLLMGMALLYGATGATELDAIQRALVRVLHNWRSVQPHVEVVMEPEYAPVDALQDSTSRVYAGFAPVALFFPGVLLVLVALLFKLGAVPMHMWTPDAYEGAPTPVTAFLAAVVKLGAIVALMRVFVGVFNVRTLVVAPYGWTSGVALVALLTMTVGNLAAMGQANVKRMLAYSSIAHVGYLLVTLVAAANVYGQAVSQVDALQQGEQSVIWAFQTADAGIAAILYYAVVYGVATIGCFAAVAWFGGDAEESTRTHQWAGLANRDPMMALGMAVCLLSLMGMPPLAGFIGKLSLFRAALANDNPIVRWLVVAALLNAVAGAYYYLRVIASMYFRPSEGRPPVPMPSRAVRGVVVGCALGSVVLGVAAQPVLELAQRGAAGFVLDVGSEPRRAWVTSGGEEAPQLADDER